MKIMARPLQALLVLCCCTLLPDHAFGSRGGSNYGWFQLDGCYREAYGVIKNYHTDKTVIDQQLQNMYNNGQRRLRIPIYHRRGGHWDGTIMDSSSQDLSTQMRQNLTDLLDTIDDIGFSEILVAFFPQGDNSPKTWDRFASSWTSWHESYFQENWNLIYNLHPIISGAGIHYKIDLLNEGAAPSSNLGPNVPWNFLWSEYTRKLWINYNIVFGKSDTVGYSIPVGNDIASRVEHMDHIYGNSKPPYLFDVHLYGDVYQRFLSVDSAMDAAGYQSGFIVGETYYNDLTAASDIDSASQAANRTVFFVTQWPQVRAETCQNVSVAPPSDYANYIQYGF